MNKTSLLGRGLCSCAFYAFCGIVALGVPKAENHGAQYVHVGRGDVRLSGVHFATAGAHKMTLSKKVSIGASSVNSTGQIEADKRAQLDDEEWFFAKGLIGMIAIAILYAILKRFDR